MKQALLFTIFIFSTVVRPVFAAANNRFGVHILFPEEVPLASELVNSSGGDWGYVVIPMQATDKNREKWQKFMADCARYHLIPILRLATFAVNQNWAKPGEWDSVDFANFLHDLDWPTKKKIVAVYNEPNHAQEWGGSVSPNEYADVLTDTIDQFKKRDPDFIMLNAGLDASAPSGETMMDEYQFMDLMQAENPDIFRQIDAFNAHSYPNPGFSANPNFSSRFNISSYQNEISYLQDNYGIYGLNVYVTETGWKKNQLLDENRIAEYYKIAYGSVWTESYIRAITPFILRADAGAFERFSILNRDQKGVIFNTIASLKKVKGAPELTATQKISQKKIEAASQKYQAQVYDDPIKFKWLWKKIAKWILK